MNNATLIEIYTDGSCHTQHCIGAWASIVFVNDHKVVLTGFENDTTHNRMEILAVIHALEYVVQLNKRSSSINIISDSQYVIGLVDRQAKFQKSNFKTKAGLDIRNVDLVKRILKLINELSVNFIKIKAHQKATEIVNYNIEVDKLCRQIVREKVGEI